MRIAFIINSLGKGGAERQASLLLHALAVEHEVQLYLLEGEVAYEVPSRVKVMSLSAPHKGWVGKIFSYLRAYPALRRALKEFRPDVSLSFMEVSNLLNLVTAKSARRIISVRIHPSSQYRRGVRSALMRLLMRKLYPRADLVVANAEESAQDLAENFRVPTERITIVSNGLDHAAIERAAKKPIRRHEAGPVILTIGRLSEQKGQLHLLRAFQNVHREYPNAKLLIIGEGELRVKLEAAAKSLGLDRHVELLGTQANPFPYIACADVFILSSLWEGFPNVLLEAMACRTPVISTACPSGPQELLDPGHTERITGVKKAAYGILVPTIDPTAPAKGEEALAAAILLLLNEPRLREHYRQRGFERSHDFSKERVLAQWRAVLESRRRRNI